MNGILFVVILAVLMVPLFLTTRRQKKMMRQTQETQANLAVGDAVMTTAGLHGVVAAVQEGTVDLEIAPGVVTRWERIAIRDRITADDDASGEDYDSDEYEPDEYGDDDLESAGFTEEELAGFSADDLTPEDFADGPRDDTSRGGAERGPRREGGTTEP